MKVKNWTGKVAMSLVAAGVASGTAQADTTVTLTGTGLANNSAIPAGHGGNAEVALTWSPDGNTPSTNWDTYITWPDGTGSSGDVYQIDGVRPYISFAPATGFAVKFNSVDLDVWAGNGAKGYELRVWAGTTPGADGAELVSYSGSAADAFGVYSLINHTVTPVTLGFMGAINQSLTLEFRQSGGTASYLAMDNFAFQTVSAIPEPGSLSLLALGGIGAAAMRRRKRV